MNWHFQYLPMMILVKPGLMLFRVDEGENEALDISQTRSVKS